MLGIPLRGLHLRSRLWIALHIRALIDKLWTSELAWWRAFMTTLRGGILQPDLWHRLGRSVSVGALNPLNGGVAERGPTKISILITVTPRHNTTRPRILD